jgi:hypothetical protein
MRTDRLPIPENQRVNNGRCEWCETRSIHGCRHGHKRLCTGVMGLCYE